MDKLQYDSFYKFLVSVGVILIMTPLIGLYYLLCNGNQLLISQSEYDNLSVNSLQFIQQRDDIILHAFSIVPWFLLILFVIGLFCLISGSQKWYDIQRELDEQTKLTTQEKLLHIKHLSPGEVVEKVEKEISNDQNLQPFNISDVKKHHSAVVKAIEIENQCFSYIKKQNAKYYNVRQNIRIGKIVMDMIAISKRDNIDILYEIKYWPSGISLNDLARVTQRMILIGPAYENSTHRNWKNILLAVTSDENYEKAKSTCHDYMSTRSLNFSVKVISESELRLQNKS